MRKRVLLLMLALCLVLSIPLCSAQSEAAAPFGPFAADRLNGTDKITESYFEGASITLVNFWATWCGPCVDELPELAKLDSLSDVDVQVVGVQLDAVDEFGRRDESATATMLAMIKDSGVTYPIVLPDEYLMGLTRGIAVIPTTLVIDSAGMLLDVIEGPNNVEGFLEIVKAYTK